MTSVQLEVPDDIYRRLIHHPALPAKIAETLHSPVISVEGGEVSGR